MHKTHRLDSVYQNTGEATVQAVLLWGADGKPLRTNALRTKEASVANDYLAQVKPQPGKSIVLVLAMGAYETYDLNQNGDGWTEFPYKQGLGASCGHPECQAKDGWIGQDEVLPRHYKTFEEFGKNFMHHQNKDPNKAVGDVLKAFWNAYMHRVELLVGLDNAKAPEIAERIAAGEFPAVSMGCRIKYDVCTICGHRAKTRADYCPHLKYEMRQVHSSGLRCGALNPSPRFFDISWVIKPADRTGYMMKKVADHEPYAIRTAAEIGAYDERLAVKRASLRKFADIDKIVRGLPVDFKTSPLSEAEGRLIQHYRNTEMPAIVRKMPVMDDDTIAQLARKPLSEVLSTLHSAGIVLTSAEFVKLITMRLSPGVKIPEPVLDTVAKLQGGIFSFFEENPQLLDRVLDTGLFDMNKTKVSPEISNIAAKYVEKRSTITEYLTRQLLPGQVARTEQPRQDALHVTDPNTGMRMSTTRGAAIDTDDQIARTQLAKVVGTGALLAGGYKILTSALPSSLHPLAAAGALGIGARYMRPDYGPQYMTDEGVPISAYTEMRKESGATPPSMASVGLPVLGTMALVTALGHDYDSRLSRGEPVNNPHDSYVRQGLDAFGETAAKHPALSTLGALTAYGMIKNKLAHETSDLELPELDFEGLALKIGQLLWPEL